MPEPLTIAGIGGALWASKDLINKLLGPTTEYLGESTRDVVRKVGDINLSNIFDKAITKAGAEIDEEGYVSPRVLKRIWDEGRFIEDDLIADYYAGALVRSRKDKNDSAITFLSILEQMSAAETRLHYELYLYDRIAFAMTSESSALSSHSFEIEVDRDNNLHLESLLRLGLLYQSAPGAGYQVTQIGATLFYMAHGLQEEDEDREILIQDISPLFEDTLLANKELNIYLDTKSNIAAYTKRGLIPKLFSTTKGFNLEELEDLKFPKEWLHGTNLYIGQPDHRY